MKKSRIMWPVAAAALVLMLGVLTGLAAADCGTGSPRSTTSATTAGLGTSTALATATVPAPTVKTTDPGTTTTPPTTTDPGTTTTTGPIVALANTLPATTQETTQSTPTSTPTSTSTATSPQTTTTVATPPTAPCDTTQITCGNNASTQVAMVTQTCTASSQNTTLNVQIQTLGGTPVNNVTISPTTTCLNTLQITQLVEQFCVACTVIVIPPPPPVIYVPEPGTNTITNTITNSVTTVETPAPPPPVRVQAYCMPKPVLRPNGTMGNLIYLPVGEPQRNPTYDAAVPATFVPGVGMKCPSGTGTTLSAGAPMFTLTVPASFVGQYVRLCLQPASPTAKPLCHSIRIDLGATISVPVTSNVIASVLKSKAKTGKALGSKRRKQISKEAGAFSSMLVPKHKGVKLTSTAHDTTRKGARR